MVDAVRVVGLREHIASFAALNPALEVNLKAADAEAARTVAADASSAATSLGGVAAHVAPSIKASLGGQVELGGSTYPMAAGAEFGGGGRPTTQQFKPWLGHTGYFLFPTIKRDEGHVDAEYAAALTEALRETGF